MKWFKHHTNASDGQTLQNLFRKFGLEGEARYWRLVQLLAKQYDGSSDIFYLSLETIRQSLRLRSLTDCRLFVDHLATISELIVEYSGNDCRIKYSKLSEIKDNHVRNLQVTGNKVTENLPLDIDKNRIEYIHTSKQSDSGESSVHQDERSYRQLLEIWNKNRGPLSEAIQFSKKRESHAKARWKEIPDPEYWSACVKKLASSKFCTGQSTGNWKATFDFLLKPDTHLKIAEGMYD